MSKTPVVHNIRADLAFSTLGHLAVACNHVQAQITLRRERFFLTFHFIFAGKKPWPTSRTNTPKTYRANSMSMINVSIAICAAKPRLPISNVTMTAGIPTSINNRRRRKKKDFARKQWKAAQSKQSGTTERNPVAAVHDRRISWPSKAVGAHRAPLQF